MSSVKVFVSKSGQKILKVKQKERLEFNLDWYLTKILFNIHVVKQNIPEIVPLK